MIVFVQTKITNLVSHYRENLWTTLAFQERKVPRINGKLIFTTLGLLVQNRTDCWTIYIEGKDRSEEKFNQVLNREREIYVKRRTFHKPRKQKRLHLILVHFRLFFPFSFFSFFFLFSFIIIIITWLNILDTLYF